MRYSYKERSCSYTKKWVVHTGNWVIHRRYSYKNRSFFITGNKLFIQESDFFRHELCMYMGVIDERKQVFQMWYSYARKWVVHIQWNKLFMRVIHTRGGVLHTRIISYAYELFKQWTELFILVHTRIIVFFSYKETSYSYTKKWVIHKRNCFFKYEFFV